MKTAIPTKGRANVIGDKALKLFPDATLCIGEEEANAWQYRRRSGLGLQQQQYSSPP